MLTQTEPRPCLHPLLVIPNKHTPFLHQLLPHRLRFIHADGPFVDMRDNVKLHVQRDFDPGRCLIPGNVERARLVEFLEPPVLPLHRDVLRGDDPNIRIHEEQRDNLPPPSFRFIRQLEPLDLVLHDIWKRDHPSFRRSDAAQLLDRRILVLKPVYISEEAVVVYPVAAICECVGLLAEGQA